MNPVSPLPGRTAVAVPQVDVVAVGTPAGLRTV